MDNYSSGEELIIKARKPYTITKQRERWTEEEHNRFLEALKLYGRAWQRIEEHIGTKTAVQIRSHAQKFFSKLEKEALVKGVPIGQAIDMEIPPPRPKRKPSNPYPRKTGATSSPNSQVRTSDGKQIPPGSTHTAGLEVVDLEKEHLSEKPVGHDGESTPKATNGGDRCTKVLTLFNEEPSSLGASSNEIPATSVGSARKLSNFTEFVPIKKPLINDERKELDASSDGHNRKHKPDKSDVSEIAQNDSENKTNAAKKFPRHAPVHILDGSLASCSQGLSSDAYQEPIFNQMAIPGSAALFSNPAVSVAVENQTSTSRSTNHHPMFPNFHPPFNQPRNKPEDYSSILQMSSTFSSMIVSALLQNPAAYAAASFAASFWPSANMENAAHSPVGICGGFPPRPMGPAPSVAAISAATVAAATAWWAAHGLLPLCTPPHADFSCPPNSTTVPLPNFPQTPAANGKREENKPRSQVQQPNQELSEALQPQHSASKSSTTSSSNSGNSCSKMDAEKEANNNEKKVPALSDQKETIKGKSKKKVDRSSCGSNTPPGSDVETDALEKNDDGKEVKEPDVTCAINEPSSRQNRIASNTNDSWKEVSKGGRLAFQALFSREVLPQSFPPSQVGPGKKQQTNDTAEGNRQNMEESNGASQLDLNHTWESCSSEQGTKKNNEERREEEIRKDGILTLFTHDQGKLKTNRTGFKPYKRCSVETRESSRVVMNLNAPEQERCSKRLRLEGEAASI